MRRPIRRVRNDVSTVWPRLAEGGPLSAGAQGLLGLPRYLYEFAPYTGCAVGRHDPPGADRVSAQSRATRTRQQTGSRAARHQPESRSATAGAPSRRYGADGADDRKESAGRGQGGVANGAAARAWRQLRHQEPFARLTYLLPRLCEGRWPLDGRHSLVARRRRNHFLWRDRNGRLD